MKQKYIHKFFLSVSMIVLFLEGCTKTNETIPEEKPKNSEEGILPASQYTLADHVEVDGRQGVCVEGDYYWVSGSKTLTKYNREWNVIKKNDNPFQSFEIEANHIGDIDVYNNEIYVGAEYFMDGEGKNIQIAIFDGDTLEYKRSFPFEPESGQLECSGLAVDPDSESIWMVSWVGEESGKYVYRYDMNTGSYLGKVLMEPEPTLIQGIAYHDGYLYITSDDGDADEDMPDHLYRTNVTDGTDVCTVTLEKTFDDVIKQGEIEGLSFDGKTNRLLVLYNRGARIIQGMPSGFYDGYDREISEVFFFDIQQELSDP